MVDRVEEALDVGIDDVVMPTTAGDPDHLKGIRGASARAEAVAARLEVRLEDRLKHDLRGHLHQTIHDRRYAQRPLPPVCLRDVLPPNRLRSVPPRSENVLKFREEPLDSPLFPTAPRQVVQPLVGTPAPPVVPVFQPVSGGLAWPN